MYFKRRIREDFAVMICGGGLLKFIPDSFLLYAQLLIPIKDSSLDNTVTYNRTAFRVIGRD